MLEGDFLSSHTSLSLCCSLSTDRAGREPLPWDGRRFGLPQASRGVHVRMRHRLLTCILSDFVPLCGDTTCSGLAALVLLFGRNYTARAARIPPYWVPLLRFATEPPGGAGRMCADPVRTIALKVTGCVLPTFCCCRFVRLVLVLRGEDAYEKKARKHCLHVWFVPSLVDTRQRSVRPQARLRLGR